MLGMRKGKFALGIVAFAAYIALAVMLSTCGGGHKQPSAVNCQSSDNRVAPPFQAVRPLETTLDDALAELAGMETPEGVDEALFEELKDALGEALNHQMESRLSSRDSIGGNSGLESPDSTIRGTTARFASTPPTGEANRVDDLAILDNGDGTFALSWHYRNLGDYDQDGVVGLPDIYPLAQHYNESYDPSDVNCLQAVIDGSGNGRIGIEEITPIAMNFAVDVHHYAVEGAPDEAGAYEPVSEIVQDTGNGDGRLEYSAVIESPAALWHRVVPVDSEGNPGEASNAVLRPSNEPVIYEAGPTEGYQHEEYTFTATVSGVEPLEYAWDFGGGATPNTSAESSPTVTLAEASEYAASLTVTNAYGEATHPFTLTVNARDIWAHTWGTSGPDIMTDTVIDGNGDVYLAEVGGVLVKFSSSGEFQWARGWDTGGKQTLADLWLMDDGRLLGCGSCAASDGDEYDDVLLIEFSDDGDVLRAMTWGTEDHERASQFVIDDAGNIYLCGSWTEAWGDESVLLMKFDAEWNVLWAKVWGSFSDDESARGIELSDGAVYVSGSKGPWGTGDALIMKLTLEGEVLWAKTWGTEKHDSLIDLIICPDGCIYAVGTIRKRDPDPKAGIILKYDRDGSLLAAKGWNPNQRSEISSVYADPYGTPTAVGSDGDDLLFVRLDSDLNVVMGKARHPEGYWNQGVSCAYDADFNLYVAGNVYNNNNPFGQWEDLEDRSYIIEGVEVVVEGTVWSPNGNSAIPDGIETEITGVIDGSGGGFDLLILKNFPR